MLLQMITGAQIRAARALLGWTQGELSTAAKISERAVGMVEGRGADPSDKTLLKMQSAMEAAGIVFSSTEEGRGVFLKKLDCAGIRI